MYQMLLSGVDSGLIAGALGSLDLSSISKEIIAVVPVVLPVAITILAVRKGISFLFGVLRGA